MNPQSTKLDQQTALKLLKEFQLMHTEMRNAVNEIKGISILQVKFIDRLNKSGNQLSKADELKIRSHVLKNSGHCRMILEAIDTQIAIFKKFTINHLN